MRFENAVIPVQKSGILDIVDLAFRFYRRHLGFFVKFVLICNIPALFFSLGVFEITGDLYFTLFIFWLMMPFASGGIIIATSRLVFGMDLSLGKTLTLYRPWIVAHFGLSSLHRLVWLPLLFLVVGEWLRLGWMFTPMILMLEKQVGKDHLLRRRALRRWSSTNAFGFDFISLLFYFTVVVAMAFVLDLVFSDFLALWEFGGLFNEALNSRLGVMLWLLLLILAMPLLDIGWFFVYLDARIRGEGWDLELGFKTMSRRIQNLNSRGHG
jgi:hypothetical protein